MKNDFKFKLANGDRIQLRYAKEEVSPDTYFDHLHRHDFFEICMPISGEMLHMANGKPYSLRRGDVFFCRPGDMHYAFCRSESVYERYALWFPPCLFSELHCGALSFMTEGPLASENFFRVRADRLDKFFSLLEGMKPATIPGGEVNILSLYGKIARLFAFLSGEAAFYAGAHDNDLTGANAPPVVNRAILFVRENFRQPCGIDDIAAELHINRDYLSRTFRRYTGLTLHDYITNVRLLESKIMLLRGNGVTETAFACGFNSTSYFIRVFRAAVGMTPAAYGRSGKQIIVENE